MFCRVAVASASGSRKIVHRVVCRSARAGEARTTANGRGGSRVRDRPATRIGVMTLYDIGIGSRLSRARACVCDSVWGRPVPDTVYYNAFTAEKETGNGWAIAPLLASPSPRATPPVECLKIEFIGTFLYYYSRYFQLFTNDP